MVKRLSASEPPDRIAFYFMAFGVLFALPAALLNWQLPSAANFVWFAGIGVLSCLGQACLSRGYALGQFSKMAPMDFFRLPTTILIGVLVFGEVPQLVTILGVAIIAGASLYVVLSGARGRRVAAAR
jgi:drug/metabolite transporter (DMT)-like permease